MYRKVRISNDLYLVHFSKGTVSNPSSAAVASNVYVCMIVNLDLRRLHSKVINDQCFVLSICYHVLKFSNDL